MARRELQRIGNLVEPTQTLSITGDPDDNRILECAVTAGSEFIVTEDRGLLRLTAFEGIRIVRAAEFLRLQI